MGDQVDLKIESQVKKERPQLKSGQGVVKPG